MSADIPLLKINSSEVRNFLPKYTQTDPPDESTLRKNCLLKCYEETMQKIQRIVRERKYLGVHGRNNWFKWKEVCKCYNWGFEKRLESIRGIISSVMLGNICSESHNNSMCLQWCYVDSVTRSCEIWQRVSASYRYITVYDKKQQKDLQWGTLNWFMLCE
jgi:hypothetical protein